MKKSCIASVILIFLSLFSVSAQQSGQVRLDMDFIKLNSADSYTIDELISNEDIIIVDGLLSNVIHYGDEIHLTIINGQWNGTQSIEMFESTIILPRDLWIDIFPERIPRNPPSTIIQLNSYLLIMGNIKEYSSLNGHKVFTIYGMQLRELS